MKLCLVFGLLSLHVIDGLLLGFLLVFDTRQFLVRLFEHALELDNSLSLLLELEGLVLGSSHLLSKSLAVIVVGTSRWLSWGFLSFLGSWHECLFQLDVFIGNFLKSFFLSDHLGFEFAIPGFERAHFWLNLVFDSVQLGHQFGNFVLKVEVLALEELRVLFHEVLAPCLRILLAQGLLSELFFKLSHLLGECLDFSRLHGSCWLRWLKSLGRWCRCRFVDSGLGVDRSGWFALPSCFHFRERFL